VVDRNADLIAWFNSLRTGMVLTADSAVLDRLAQIRDRMVGLEQDIPGYTNRAITFALDMKPANVTGFCSFLEFFEREYLQETNRQLANDQDAPILLN
jgi:hypothetical protein